MTIDDAAPPPDPLAEALRAKLRSLLDDPLTPKSLSEIEQTARLAKELIAVGRNPLVMNRRRGGGGFVFNQPGMGIIADDGDDDEPAMATSPKAETFGATVIREAISAYAEIMSRPRPVSPHELLLAISMAKAHEMPELAAQLEQDLRAQFVGPEPGAATPERVAELMEHYAPPAAPVQAVHVCTPADMGAGS